MNHFIFHSNASILKRKLGCAIDSPDGYSARLGAMLKGLGDGDGHCTSRDRDRDRAEEALKQSIHFSSNRTEKSGDLLNLYFF